MFDLRRTAAERSQPHYVIVDQLNATQWEAYTANPAWPTSGAADWVEAVSCGLILIEALGFGLMSRSLAGEVLVLAKPRALIEVRS